MYLTRVLNHAAWCMVGDYADRNAYYATGMVADFPNSPESYRMAQAAHRIVFLRDVLQSALAVTPILVAVTLAGRGSMTSEILSRTAAPYASLFLAGTALQLCMESDKVLSAVDRMEEPPLYLS